MQARSQRDRWGQLPSQIPKVAPKIFRLKKLLMCKPKKYFSANQQNCFRNLSYFKLFSNLIKAVWLTSWPWLIKRCVHGCQKDSFQVGKQGHRQWGGSGTRPPHLKFVSPHFTFGPLVAGYVQYSILKMWPPLLGFCPSYWFLAPLLLNPVDGPGGK